MLTKPTLSEIVNGPRGMLRGIEVSVSSQCLVSAVTLMFAAVDALAALSRPQAQAETDRSIFIAWLDTYLFPTSVLHCTASDLYGARCGVLHTYSPESRLWLNGQARPLFYQWRSGPPANSQRNLPIDAIIVEIESLQSAVQAATHAFIEAEQFDQEVSARVAHHLPKLLCYIPW